MLPQSLDTHIDIEKIQISMIRRESSAKKASQICSLSQCTRQLSRRAIKRANQTLTERELSLLFISYLYGSDLANRVCHYFKRFSLQMPVSSSIFWENKQFLSERLSNRETVMQNQELIMAIEPVVKVFNQLGILYYIGGSIASSVYGMPRATQDVDIVTDLKSQHANFLAEQLGSAYYVDIDMILDAIGEGSCFNLIHLDTMIKIDIFITKDEPYHRSAFRRKREDTLDEQDNSLQFYIASSEDVILSKLDWFRIGGYVSEQQWRDIQGVLKVQQESLDLKYLSTWAQELKLADLLKKAFHEAGILQRY